MEQKSSSMAKYSWVLFVLILLVSVYSFTGFFVTQPIGAIPDGATIWFFRTGTNFSFITSADGRLIDRDIYVSLLGRSTALKAIIDQVESKKIMNLPYIKPLYLFSTHGVEFEN